jgi:hypothetical protein
MGIVALRKIQLGRESSAGTAVAATAIWRGLGTLQDERELVYSPETIGYLSGTTRGYFPSYGALFAFDPIEATFEQILHPLEGGILTVGSGTADGGGGSGKIYDYTFPTTSANTIKTYTIEGGDDIQAEEAEYCFVENFELSGSQGAAWMIAPTWRGRQVSLSTFTGALTAPTVEEMLFGKTKLYLDTASDAFGTTIKSSTLLEARISFDTGWRVIAPTGDGNLYFPTIKNIGPVIELSITFEHNSTSVAEIAAWRAGTPRAIQLKCEGSALTTPGSTYTYKTVIINVAGKWRNFDKIGEMDGNDVVTGTLVARYDANGAKFGNIIVVNEVASVP